MDKLWMFDAKDLLRAGQIKQCIGLNDIFDWMQRIVSNCVDDPLRRGFCESLFVSTKNAAYCIKIFFPRYCGFLALGYLRVSALDLLSF